VSFEEGVDSDMHSVGSDDDIGVEEERTAVQEVLDDSRGLLNDNEDQQDAKGDSFHHNNDSADTKSGAEGIDKASVTEKNGILSMNDDLCSQDANLSQDPTVEPQIHAMSIEKSPSYHAPVEEEEEVDRELSREPESDDDTEQFHGGRGTMRGRSPSPFIHTTEPIRPISRTSSQALFGSLNRANLLTEQPSVHVGKAMAKVDDGVECSNSEDDDSEDDEGVLDLGVVKITSDDPKAAARAAAILKLVC
jgi:hypothetical protein